MALFDGAAYRIDLPKETMAMAITINLEKEGEDIERNLLLKNPGRGEEKKPIVVPFTAGSAGSIGTLKWKKEFE